MSKFAFVATVLILTVPPSASQAQPGSAPIDMPALMKRVAPGEGQSRLQSLLGRWRVRKVNYLLGSPGRPAVSTDMVTERHMIGDGRFVSDTTTGSLGGRPYFRTGILGYNNIARRYELVTADNVTPILMTYIGRNGTLPSTRFDMFGTFNDPGVTGERNVGAVVSMRTEIRIVNRDTHEIDLYFTPPGGRETLVDEMVYTRLPAAGRR